MSFRITRTAEDLAQTITALTQRLVKLEQRQEALELQVRQQLDSVKEVPEEERATLDGIDQLLRETRELLQLTDSDVHLNEQGEDDQFSQEIAA